VFRRYGPFWTCTTLIFVAASIATFVTYLSHKWHKKEWNYDINLVTWSAGLFYGYVTFVPLLLYVILKYFSAPAGLVQLWCLYGYSLFIFIPASVRTLPRTYIYLGVTTLLCNLCCHGIIVNLL
jgi:protein YIPF1/2